MADRKQCLRNMVDQCDFSTFGFLVLLLSYQIKSIKVAKIKNLP